MEIRTQRFLLDALKASILMFLVSYGSHGLAEDQLIEPDVVPQKVDEALIDTVVQLLSAAAATSSGES